MPSVPKPTAGLGGKVACKQCGTYSSYSLEDMLKHKTWCGAAKSKADKSVKEKNARSKCAKRRR
jgi:hypothetical protein